MFGRIGVRGRLLLSFVGISGLSVLAAAAALFTFAAIRATLDEITEQWVPMALAARDLSAQVERIVAGAPALLKARNPSEQTEVWNRLSDETREIDAQLASFRDHGATADTLSPLQGTLASLRANLLLLNTIAGESIVLADRKAVLLADLEKDYAETGAVLATWSHPISELSRRLYQSTRLCRATS